MKASIIAVGTELTTGQIVNRNSSWISQKLNQCGLEILLHLTVPDERDLIAEALAFAESKSDVLFVTGGLGPTSDDFTRELIAEWAEQEMIFDEASWTHIQNRLRERGFPVRDMQKQQCYFPKSARILSNSAGTAHGFSLDVTRPKGKKTVFVLPGPPREIEAIWKDHLESWVSANTKGISKKRTKAWDTLGLGESEVAHSVENILNAFPQQKAKVEVGYRVHLPYVEVKLTFVESVQNEVSALLSEIDKALDSITITRDFSDLAEVCAGKISKQDFTFYDFVTQGFLHHRLNPVLKKQTSWSFKQGVDQITADFFQDEENFLAVLPQENEKALVLWNCNGKPGHALIDPPMKSPLMAERRKQFITEMALLCLSRV